MAPCSTLASALKRLAAQDGDDSPVLPDHSTGHLKQPSKPVRLPKQQSNPEGESSSMKILKRVACWCGRQLGEVCGAIKYSLMIAVCGVIFAAALLTFINYAVVILTHWRL